MELLIVTQAVDKDDPVLGFFIDWITEFAKRCEFVHVVCLREGLHTLPANVRVHSLGKSSRGVTTWRSRSTYILRFFRYMYRLRHQYDAVFVHMNPEYVLLGGVFWRQWGKKIVLWRNHKKSGMYAWIGAHLSHTVCYTSPQAYVAKFSNAVQMPIGIDTEAFKPAPELPPSQTILFLGRLDTVKRPDVFVQALERLHEQSISFQAEIVGDPTDPKSLFAHGLRNRAATLVLEGVLSLRPSVSHANAPALFASHAIYVNLTPSGSFDKTIGEAMASGCITVVTNDALRDVVPEKLLISDQSTESTADALHAALIMNQAEREALARTFRAYVEREHSLSLLAERLFGILSA